MKIFAKWIKHEISQFGFFHLLFLNAFILCSTALLDRVLNPTATGPTPLAYMYFSFVLIEIAVFVCIYAFKFGKAIYLRYKQFEESYYQNIINHLTK
jgi:hypothetical protein